jgi:hypothetical protein
LIAQTDKKPVLYVVQSEITGWVFAAFFVRWQAVEFNATLGRPAVIRPF